MSQSGGWVICSPLFLPICRSSEYVGCFFSSLYFLFPFSFIFFLPFPCLVGTSLSLLFCQKREEFAYARKLWLFFDFWRPFSGTIELKSSTFFFLPLLLDRTPNQEGLVNIVPVPPANNPTPLFFPGSVPGGDKKEGKKHSQCGSVFKKDCYCIPPKFEKKCQILAVCNSSLF